MPGNPFDQFDSSGGYRTEKQLGQQVASLPSERDQWSQESPWVDENLDQEIGRAKLPNQRAALLEEKNRKGAAGGGGAGGNPFDQFDAGTAPAAPASAPAAPAQAPSLYDKYMPEAMKGPLGTMRNAVGAVAEPIMAMGSAMVAKPVSDVVGLASLIPAIGTGGKIDPTAVKRDVQNALTYQPRTQAGQAVSEYNPLALLGKAVGWTADKAGGAVKGETPGPLRDALGNLVHEGIEQAPGLLGIKAPPVGAAIGRGLRQGAENFMQSAVKPGEVARRTGKAEAGVGTLLDEGINATRGGMNELQGRVDQLNQQIAAKLQSSTARIDQAAVADRLKDSLDKFALDATPMDNIAAIQKKWDEFMNHPLLNGKDMPVQTAQEIKQGTYRTLKDSSFGELKGADIEARKALARGLKEEIAQAVPEVKPLNAEESKLLTSLNLVERRVLMEANKNPVGFGWFTTDPVKFAGWMADRSALFKSLVARMLNTGSKVAPMAGEYGPALGMAVGAQAQRP